MIYVLDSNVAVKWVVTEGLSDKAQLLRDDFKNQVHELLSPDIFPAEVIHALARAERQGRITPAQGGRLFADVMSTPPQFSPYQPLIPRAYDIASKARIGVYDASTSRWPNGRNVSWPQRMTNWSTLFRRRSHSFAIPLDFRDALRKDIVLAAISL